MAKLRLMLDANIILDVLTKREPFFTSSAFVWAAVETNQVEGYTAAHSITTIYYIISRHISKEKALSAIGDLLLVFSIAEVNQSVLLQALALGWDDFEDGVQVCAAAQTSVDFFVTRDIFKVPTDLVTIIKPEDFIGILQALKKP